MPRILVVEDSLVQAEQMRLILQQAGVEVVVAQDGQQGLDSFLASDFDLVITDVVMPGLTGYELCRRIKQHPTKRRVPVLLVTVLRDPLDILQGIECGADNYLTKPYRADALISRVQYIFANHARRMDSQLKFGLEVDFLGKSFTITSEKEQILDLLLATCEDVVRTNRELAISQTRLTAANGELLKLHQDLESRIQTRTAELAQANSSLRESESRYRFLFERNLAGVILIRSDGTILGGNEAAAHIFGVGTLDELLKRQLLEFFFDPAECANLTEAVLRDHTLTTREIRFRRADGQPVWTLANVSLLQQSQDGQVFHSTLIDITKRKRIEDANLTFTKRLRILHQVDKALIEGASPEDNAAAMLPLLRDLLGVARVVVNLFHLGTGEVEWLAAAGRRRVHSGPGIHYPLRFMGDLQALHRGENQLIDVYTLPPGPEVDALLASGVHSYFVVPMIAHGELIGAISFGGATNPLSHDQIGIVREVATQFAIAITQARLHERLKVQSQELAVQNHTLTTLINASPLAIVVLDVQGRVKVWSEAAEKIFGWSAAEVLGHPVPLVPEEKQEEAQSLTAKEMAGEATTELETYGMRRDRTRVDLVLSSAPLKDANGVIIGAVRILGDITARKRLEVEFRQAQKMEAVGRLAGGIAHDFNNLLTVINGYSELMLSSLPAGDRLHHPIEEILRSGERAAALTGQLLSFSRKQVIEPVSLDLNILVKEMEKMLSRLIREDIDLLVSPNAPLWSVKSDRGQMEQVLMNLVVNARDAMPTGGKLTIETANVELDASYVSHHPEARSGDYVLLAVSDTGCGMDSATQAHIFEPFFTTKAIGKGTGLGLATVYGIVKQSGGTIDVYSEVGIGTSFKIYLPRDREPSVQTRTMPTAKLTLEGKETVLLAEDEASVRSLSRLVLHSHGYTVLEAKDGAEALRVAEQHQGKIDILVTDVIMPLMSGRELAERLVALLSMKVLFISGYTDDAIVHHGVLTSDTPFLHKPFSPRALARRVREVLDQKEDPSRMEAAATR